MLLGVLATVLALGLLTLGLHNFLLFIALPLFDRFFDRSCKTGGPIRTENINSLGRLKDQKV
jgi:hypothetical protein